MSALKALVDGMKVSQQQDIPQNSQPTAISQVVEAVRPTINDLLAQNIPRTSIKQTINDYYAANPEGVTAEGLQTHLRGLSQAETTIAPQGQSAAVPVVNPAPPTQEPPPLSSQPPPTMEEANRRVITPSAVSPPVLMPETQQTAPSPPQNLNPAPSKEASTQDNQIPDHLDAILSSDSPENINSHPENSSATEIPQHLNDLLSDGQAATPSEPDKKSDLLYRIATGLQDPLVGIGQAAVHLIPSALEPPGYAEQVDKEISQREADYRKNHDVEGVDWARIGGQIATPANAMLPLKSISSLPVTSALGRVARGSLSVATMAASQPTETDENVGYAGAKAFQTGVGAIVGAGTTALGELAAKAIKPEVSPDVQTLLDHNIRVGTDQMSGEGGSKLTSVPIVGNLINENHNRAVEDLNTAVLNKSLGELGEKIPPTVAQAGNDALAYTRQRLSEHYDNLLPTLSGNINDATTNTLGQRLLTDSESVIGGEKPMSFSDKFSKLMQDKYYDMHLPTTEQLGKILTKEITGVVNNDGSFNGEQFKNIETGLNYKISNYSASPNPQDRLLANALTDVKGLLKDQLSASNPEGEKALANINRAYSTFKVAQRAASSTAAPNGIFNPSQLYAAVKNADKTLDKRAFTEGTLPLYDLASAAKNVLSNYKDSGTAGRALAAYAAGGVMTGGGASALMAHPIGTALGSLTAGYYTQPGQAAARYLMTSRPEYAGALSDLVRKATDAATVSPYTK